MPHAGPSVAGPWVAYFLVHVLPSGEWPPNASRFPPFDPIREPGARSVSASSPACEEYLSLGQAAANKRVYVAATCYRFRFPPHCYVRRRANLVAHWILADEFRNGPRTPNA